MEYFPAPLEKLVEQFAKLPGIGGKSAQRLAFHVLGMSEAEAQDFADAILTAKRTVTTCPVCRNLTAGGLCPICVSAKRDAATICVVADARDVVAMERASTNSNNSIFWGINKPWSNPDSQIVAAMGKQVICKEFSGTNEQTEHKIRMEKP